MENSMKKFIAIAVSALTIVALPLASFGDDTSNKMNKMSKMSKLTVDQRIQMHEDAIKLNQDAVDCLKSNKPEMECAKNFKMGMQDMHKKYWPNSKGKMKHCMMEGNE